MKGAGATIEGPLSQFRGGGAPVLTGQSCPHTIWTNNKQRYRGSHLFALFIKKKKKTLPLSPFLH